LKVLTHTDPGQTPIARLQAGFLSKNKPGSGIAPVGLLLRALEGVEQGFVKPGILLHHTPLNPHKVIDGSEPRSKKRLAHLEP
jgi:hypothetical protein